MLGRATRGRLCGRRPIILASLLIEALSLALSALAGSLYILLVARFIGGLGASNIGSAQAVVADVTPVEGRSRGMGLIGAAIGLGFVVGPALGGLLAPLGPAVPFWAAMIAALTNALLVLCFLPETRCLRAATRDSCLGSRYPTPPSTAPTPTGTVGAFPYHVMGVILAGWRQVLRYPAVAQLVVINFLFTVAFTVMEAVLPLFTQQAFGWTALQNGSIFRLGMLAAGLALLSWSMNLALLLVALGIVSIGDGVVMPMVSALLSFASLSDAQGETLGIAQGIAGLGRVIGPLAAGSIFAIGGPGAPFFFASTLVVLAALIAAPPSKHKVSLTHSTPAVQTISTAQDSS